MDVTTLRIAATLASFATFLGIAWWAYSRAQPRPLRRGGAHSLRTRLKRERAMSDFNADFWSVYVAGLTLVSILACLLLLWITARKKIVSARRQHHRPRLGRGPARDEQPHAALVDVAVRAAPSCSGCCTWWPTRAWAAYEGELRWTTARRIRRRGGARPSKELAPLYAQFTASKAEELAGDPQAMAIGERLFMNNCAQCHGSDARGSKGFPNLADNDWLLRRHARARSPKPSPAGAHGQMPPMAAAVGSADDVKNVANYVLSLSNSPHDSLRAQLGKTKFTRLRRLPRHRRQGQRGAGRAQPHRRHLAARLGRAGHHRHHQQRQGQRHAGAGRQADRGADPGAGAPMSGACPTSLRRQGPDGDGRAVFRHVARSSPSFPCRRSEEAGSLYEAQKKIYPRSVSGIFARWRWVFVALTQLVFYGLPWLEWGQRQAVLFDLGARRFYIFGLVLYPQDFIYLTGLLVISALSLFLFTAVAGRLWCGFACPQTVYTEMFLWIERKVEGDRSARMRLDGSPMSPREAGQEVVQALPLDRPGACGRASPSWATSRRSASSAWNSCRPA